MADMPLTAPAVKPANPNFSSGPCAKRPGWTTDALKSALVGRSHRAKPAKARIEKAIALTRELLEVPADYRIGIVPASDTGAVEMSLWSALGARGVDMLAWEIVRRGLGDRRAEAAQAAECAHHHGRLRLAARPQAGQLRQRRGVHLERHDLGRARAERRLDPGRPQGADDLRRDLGRLRAEPRFPKARCGDLLLAEGAGRRGGARHPDPLARARSSGSRPTSRPGRCRRSSA